MAEKKCDNCGDKKENKHLGKIRGKLLCKKCRTEIRLNRREETIEKSGIKEELRLLKNKEAREYRKKRIGTIRKPGRPKINKGYEPKIKGSVRGKVRQKNKSESYLGFQESQILLKILIKRGLDFEEAKEIIANTKKELSNTRQKLKNMNKSEEEIKTKQQQMIEELYKY
jgi:hypothetical protein